MNRIEISENDKVREQNSRVKEWLWRYRYAKLDVRRLEGEYMELVSIQESAGALNYDGMPHGSGTGDLSGLMISRDAELTKLIKSMARANKIRSEITSAIDQLSSPIERDILSLRYIQLKDGYGVNDMQDIADITKYTVQHVKRVHGIALFNIAPIIRKMLPNATK